MDEAQIPGYRYANAQAGYHHAYLLPMVLKILDALALSMSERRLFELGCGNSSVAHVLRQRDWEVTGAIPPWKHYAG